MQTFVSDTPGFTNAQSLLFLMLPSPSFGPECGSATAPAPGSSSNTRMTSVLSPKAHPSHWDLQGARTALKNSITEESKVAEAGVKFTFGDCGGGSCLLSQGGTMLQ